MNVPRRAAAGLLAFVAGCAHHGSLNRGEHFSEKPARVEVTEIPVKGFEVRVIQESGSLTEGELLAEDDEYLYVLVGGETLPIRIGSVKMVALDLYDSGALTGALWTTVGTLSTVTHGWFLVLTSQAWVGVGVGTSVGMAVSTERDAKPDHIEELYQFARFPQGLPPTWPRNQHPEGAAPPSDERRRAVEAEEHGVPGVADAGVDAVTDASEALEAGASDL